MIISHHTMDLRCANHVSCNARALFNAETEERCKEKAKRAGWHFFLKRGETGRLIDECKCNDCKGK